MRDRHGKEHKKFLEGTDNVLDSASARGKKSAIAARMGDGKRKKDTVSFVKKANEGIKKGHADIPWRTGMRFSKGD